jgi:scyllo-inositol 2-dehydrogenase (NADP+)
MTNPAVKTGICSFGMSGKLFHAPFIQSHPGYELAAIVERTKQESGDKYPAAQVYPSVEEMLQDNSLQLIIVNTPVQTHYDYVKKALDAGKMVVVEKPFTVTVEEAQKLEAYARDKNLLLTVYQNRRYDGDFFAIKEIINEGVLGELKEVEMRFDRFRPAFSGKTHKEGSIPGAGSLHDLGAHLIDQALQLFGWPEALFADLRTLRKDVGANDYFEILLYYPEIRVRLKSTVIARESYYAYILHGTNGTFLQQRSDMQEQELLAGRMPTIENWCPAPSSPDGLLHTGLNNDIIRKETTSSPGNYMGFYEDLLHAIKYHSENPVPASDGILIMKIIEAALHSNNEGKKIRL